MPWYRRFFVATSHDRPETETPAGGQSVTRAVRAATRHHRHAALPAFQQICIATFCIFNAYNTVAGFAWFIIVYYMNQGDPAVAGVWPTLFGSVSALCTCFLVIPTVNWLAQRYGKRATFMITQSISVFGYALFWWSFNPENPI